MQSHLKKLLPFSLTDRRKLPPALLYRKFQEILERNGQVVELMEDMGDKLGGEYVFDGRYLEDLVSRLEDQVFLLLSDFAMLTRRKDGELYRAFGRIKTAIEAELAGRYTLQKKDLVLPLSVVTAGNDDLAGEKMAALGQLGNRLLLPTADGFVITTAAFTVFMEKRKLLKKAEHGASCWQSGNVPRFLSIARQMQEEIQQASLPRSLSAEIMAQFDALAERVDRPDLRVVLRSSGRGENSGHSFAGQYRTLLNLPRGEVLTGYRSVLASFYDPAAWRYRLQKGYRENESCMAVGCQAMVDARVSGVVHSFAPHIAPDSMVVNGAWGLCELVMQGVEGADVVVVRRNPPYPVISTKIASKTRRLRPDEKGGTFIEETPTELQEVLCLTPDQLQQLTRTAMNIERYYRRPQEIEWSFDSHGNLVVLQVRPLHFRGTRFVPVQQVREAIRVADIILRDRGFTVQCGIGVGRVVIVEKDEDLETFPDGAILVSRHASPRYASVMHRARGIITDTGSPTGHMSTLAREYRIPTMVGAEIASTLLHNGDEVTLDATHGVVYKGFLYPLDSFELTDEEPFEDSYEYRLLRRLFNRVSRLNLLESGEASSPQRLLTYRDIIHYVQIRAVEELISQTEKSGFGKGRPARRLEMEIPLGLYVIDAGGGTREAEKSRTLQVGQVISLPLRIMLEGLLNLGMWCTDPVSVDLASFMSSFTRTFCPNLAGPQEVGRNLAVVTADYANINLRLGYHFTLIDASLADAVDDDYISFRFWGGVTEPLRRSRRAAFIEKVLTLHDFLAEVHGDLVVGRLKKRPLAKMTAAMRMLGGLIGYTRQLDACLHANSDIAVHADRFVETMSKALGGHHG